MHEKLLWFNPNIQFMFHGNIVEYDMKAMSVSISEQYGLLDNETIELLKLLPKDQRTRKIGLIQRDDKDFSQRLINSELNTRKKFLEMNHLDESTIISLHSDACVFNSRKKIKNVIDGIEFRHVDTWTSYINYKGIEMFYNDGVITYKGVPKELLNQHTLGIHKYLLNVFDKVENYDPDVLRYLSKFQMRYLQDKLPDYFYNPFGRKGEYKISNLELFAFIANVVIQEMKGQRNYE